MNPDTEAAWEIARGFAAVLAAADLPGYRATYAIGSLPGGYFDPASSDIDLVALFAGTKPGAAQQQALNARIAALLEDYLAQHPGPEVECLARFESEISRDAHGLLPNPDLAARMRQQSRCLDGAGFPLRVDAPTAQDFQGEFARFLTDDSALQTREGTRAAPRIFVNHALALMRLYLAVYAGGPIYEKSKLPAAFQAANPSVKVPQTFLAHWQQVRNGAELDPETQNSLREAVLNFKNELHTQARQDL